MTNYFGYEIRRTSSKHHEASQQCKIKKISGSYIKKKRRTGNLVRVAEYPRSAKAK
jgi:hypothetical protein